MKTANLGAALVLLLATTTWAREGEIKERKENQQDRIAQGIQSGQLTANEAARLEGQEAAINKEEHQMREADGGKLTSEDRAKINRQQNRTSRRIYRQKHDAQHQ
jgi:hypothetical protein